MGIFDLLRGKSTPEEPRRLADGKVDMESCVGEDVPKEYNVTGEAIDNKELFKKIDKDHKVTHIGELHSSEATKELQEFMIKEQSPSLLYLEGIATKHQKARDNGEFKLEKGIEDAVSASGSRVIGTEHSLSKLNKAAELKDEINASGNLAQFANKLIEGEEVKNYRSGYPDEESYEASKSLFNQQAISSKDSTGFIIDGSKLNEQEIAELTTLRNTALKRVDEIKAPFDKLRDERMGDGKLNQKAGEYAVDAMQDHARDNNGETPETMGIYGMNHYTEGDRNIDETVADEMQDRGLEGKQATILVEPTDRKDLQGRGFRLADDINKNGEEYVMFVEREELDGSKEAIVNRVDATEDSKQSEPNIDPSESKAVNRMGKSGMGGESRFADNFSTGLQSVSEEIGIDSSSKGQLLDALKDNPSLKDAMQNFSDSVQSAAKDWDISSQEASQLRTEYQQNIESHGQSK